MASTIVVNFVANKQNFDSGLASAQKSLDKFGNNANGNMDNLSKHSDVVSGIIAGLFASAFSKIESVVTSSIGDAVSRFDTLNNSARTFANMGFSNSTITSTMANLKSSILGLPTSLDSAVRGVEMLAGASGNLAKSQQIYKAINDGILGFGGTTDMVSNAVLQFAQNMGLSDVQAQTFNSMMNSGMGPALSAIATKFGMTTGQLKDNLGALGTLTINGQVVGDKMGWLEQQLVSLDQNGGGGMKSLTQIAKDSTAGIGTSFTNAGTAVTRGITDIITSLNKSVGIADIIKNAGSIAESALNGIAKAVTFVGQNAGAFGTLTSAIAGAMAAMIAFSAYQKVAAGVMALYTTATIYFNTVQDLMTQGLTLGQAAMEAFNIVLDANPIGIIVVAIVALVAGLTYFFTQTKIGQQVFQTLGRIVGTVFGAIGTAVGAVVNFFVSLWNAITGVVSAIVSFLMPAINVVIAVFGVMWQILSTIVGIYIKIYEIIFTLIIVALIAIWNTIVAVFSPIVGFIGGVFSAVWNTVLAVIGAITGVFGTVWNTLVAVFSPIIGFIGGVFQGAWNAIVSVFSAVGGFFSKVWNTITGIFGSIGSAMGNAIVGAFKFVVNGILGFLESFLNGPINALNALIGVIDHIPGVHISKLNNLRLPRMALGAIVDNPTLALVGESGREAVMPLENNTGWINELADKINTRNGAGMGVTQYNTVQDNVDMAMANRDLFRMARRAV